MKLMVRLAVDVLLFVFVWVMGLCAGYALIGFL